MISSLETIWSTWTSFLTVQLTSCCFVSSNIDALLSKPRCLSEKGHDNTFQLSLYCAINYYIYSKRCSVVLLLCQIFKFCSSSFFFFLLYLIHGLYVLFWFSQKHWVVYFLLNGLLIVAEYLYTLLNICIAWVKGVVQVNICYCVYEFSHILCGIINLQNVTNT